MKKTNRDPRLPTMFHNAFGIGLRMWVYYALIALPLVPLSFLAVSVQGFGGANGRHVGYVTAVEDQTNATWNSTVVYVKSNPESTQEDTYCVQDATVRAALDRASEKRSPVVIHYHNGFVLWRWECNGGESIIVGVDEVKP